MKIVGCDLHTRYQQIAMLDTETGELIERRLEHANGEARAFYAGLQGPARVGIEATGHTRWFERRVAQVSRFSRPGNPILGTRSGCFQSEQTNEGRKAEATI